MIKNLILTFFYLLKSLLKVKTIILLITTSFLVLRYYTHFKFNKTKPELLSIDVTTKPFLSQESQIELELILLKTYNIPKNIIEKVLYKIESQTTHKNLIFLSFYEKNFINKQRKYETQQSYFDYNKQIKIDDNLFAVLHTGNPFLKESNDKITIRNHTGIITIGTNKYLFINKIYKRIIEKLTYLDEYNTFQECQAINNIFKAIRNSNNIATIEKASKNLFIIKSEKLRAMLLQQLQIKAYHFWCKLKIDQKTKEFKVCKTDKVLLHPHFFIHTINPVLHKKQYFLFFKQQENLFSVEELFDIVTTRQRYHTSSKKILEEKSLNFYISSDYNKQYITYPNQFVIIEKDNQPLIQ